MNPKYAYTVMVVILFAQVLVGAGGNVVVRRSGATGNGITDDTAAIQSAIDRAPLGGTVDFGKGLSYRITGTLTLRRALTYVGSSRIRMDPNTAHGTPIAILPHGQAAHIRIEGLTFDASGVGGILLISVGGSATEPAINVVIRRNIFQNSNPDGASDAQSAIYDPVGLRNSEISSNRFINVGNGIVLTNVSNTAVSRNDFDTVLRGDAISISYDKASDARGPVTISSNTTRHLSRMAIEVRQPSADSPGKVTVEDNRLSDWSPVPIRSNQAFGISIVGGSGHRIVSNQIAGSAPVGIELGSVDTIVDGNLISGFETGIVLHEGSGSTIANNKIIGAKLDGISLTNAGAHRRIRIVNNYIENAKRAGVAGLPASIADIEFAGNRISREGGFYPDDHLVTFYGFQVQPGCEAPSTWRDNTIIQTSAVPPGGFRFFGFGVFGGCAGNRYYENVVASRSSTPLGSAFLIYGPDLLDGATIEKNRFVSLAQVLEGQPAGSISSRNNVGCNMRDRTLISSIAGDEACKARPEAHQWFWPERGSDLLPTTAR